jgi:deoxycytidylate deaminase
MTTPCNHCEKKIIFDDVLKKKINEVLTEKLDRNPELQRVWAERQTAAEDYEARRKKEQDRIEALWRRRST